MKFYRNHYALEEDNGESVGYAFFTSKAAALTDAKDKTPYHGDRDSIAVPVEVMPTKQGILEALNREAGHPDNG